MDERYIASVDLGTSKIAVAVARVEGEDIQMIYYRETPSDGIRQSHVFNPEKASLQLRYAVGKAESDLGIKIHQAVVGLPRYYVRQELASATMERAEGDDCITQGEIDILKSNAVETYPLSDPEKEVIYGAVAQSFTVEDYFQTPENEIVGMVSPEIEGHFKAFVGAKRSSTNIDKVFNKIGIAVAEKFFTPDVVSKAVLTREEKENGVALIELGAGVTSVTVYHDNIMRHYGAVKFGGNTITNDIKLECGTSTELAENLKMGFGACLPDKLASMSEKILQISYVENSTEKQLPVKYLSEIITCREREIIDAMLYEIEMSGYADQLRSGVVITGGGANITNCAALIKEMSGYSVREGYPLHLFTSEGCSGLKETEASTSVGLILAGAGISSLNCTSEPPVRQSMLESGTAEASAETAAEPAPAAEEQAVEEQPVKQTLFSDDEIETVKPKKGPKKPKEKKPKMTWFKQVAEGVKEKMNSLYEDMEDDR